MTTKIIIKNGQYERQYWRDLWAYRELFYVLGWRDVSVHYKQTVIGLAWAIIRPLFSMIVLTIVFGKIANLPSVGDIPYPLLVFVGLLPWQLFSTVLSEASSSVISNGNLISKVYFPRIIVPISSSIVSLFDFLVSLGLLVIIMIYYHQPIGWQILFLPFFVLLALMASLGPGLWIAALNVKYRDFRYIIPLILQLSFYLSPVGFTSSIVPEQWKMIYFLNPAAGVIEGFRWAILGDQAQLFIPGFLISFLVIIFFIWFGVREFRKMERSFADLL